MDTEKKIQKILDRIKDHFEELAEVDPKYQAWKDWMDETVVTLSPPADPPPPPGHGG